jgi:hypothetical protein
MYKVLPGNRAGSGHHTMPTKRLAPLHWTIVRNPYDRAVSLYGSTALREGDMYKVKKECGSSEPDFETFIRKCLLVPKDNWKNVRNTTNKYLFRNQYSWISSGIVDTFVHLENLEEEVYNLIGIQIPKEKENKSDRGSWEEYINPIVIELLNEWAGEDFKEYGYEKL